MVLRGLSWQEAKSRTRLLILHGNPARFSEARRNAEFMKLVLSIADACILRRSAGRRFSVLQEYVVTLNNVFLQYIEHLDKNGFVSIWQMLVFGCQTRGNMLSYSEGVLPDNLPVDFVGCVPMPFLMVPPGHQDKIRPVLKALADLGSSLSAPGK